MNDAQPEQLPVEQILDSMAESLDALLIAEPMLVAIQTGGVWIAEHLHQKLKINEPLGAIDISFYRDDFSRVDLNPKVHESYLPEPIDDRNIILVDDVLNTGRTVRAALNELFSWGRPASVKLAVLLDKGNRELPLGADVVGHTMSLKNNQFVKISPSGRLIYSDSNHH
ncbi:MAG: bifunctional pyr operon transcriptional regulator/uracil phosphoribosyltransferase PyrR [Acidiferrobacterales bacterium]|nr:bifunctional pyr operon transcriptional regulator/uracil phosphoribosyltransferase PyrR [Acidiferrobacterales bacterium]